MLALEAPSDAQAVNNEKESAGSDLKKRKRKVNNVVQASVAMQVDELGTVGIDLGYVDVSGGDIVMTIKSNLIFDEHDVTVGPVSQARREQ